MRAQRDEVATACADDYTLQPCVGQADTLAYLWAVTG